MKDENARFLIFAFFAYAGTFVFGSGLAFEKPLK